ncbi:inositol monophosphatase family protein [Streptomyces sp. NPDC050164]|uniref:inositol monophosphatase family protein n=1 Tax=Streptomyces sp. NPDC050164 TaxID=3365605 RepID=UPI00378987D7
MTYLTFLEYLLEDAAKMALTLRGRTPSQIKDSDVNQVVTQADMVIGRRLERRIHEQFPHDSIIDEESCAVPGTSSVTWIIDPIDGTSNFAAGSPLFGVMVGVLEHGTPLAGGVALPALSETYVAEVGQGAYRNGTRLKRDAKADLSRQLFAYGIDIYPSEIENDCRILGRIASLCGGVRMSNSVFDCMMVATGAYGGFMHRRNRIWDCVAPQVVIEEAGGIFSTMDGDPVDYVNPLEKTTRIFPILTSGHTFHKTIVDAVREFNFE